jgi:hypothetical protein
MYTVEAFIPYREPEDPEHHKSYPVWLGNNTLLSILPGFTYSSVGGIILLASYDLTNWFEVSDECGIIELEDLHVDQIITLDPRIMLPYPYLKIWVPIVIPDAGVTLTLSIGDVT